MRWELRIPLRLIQPRQISSTMSAYVVVSSPKPPYSSGMIDPKRPISRMRSMRATGYSFACSISLATGITSFWTNSRMVVTMPRWVSVS